MQNSWKFEDKNRITENILSSYLQIFMVGSDINRTFDPRVSTTPWLILHFKVAPINPMMCQVYIWYPTWLLRKTKQTSLIWCWYLQLNKQHKIQCKQNNECIYIISFSIFNPINLKQITLINDDNAILDLYLYSIIQNINSTHLPQIGSFFKKSNANNNE